MADKLPHMPLWVYDLDTDRDCRAMPDSQFGRYMRLLIRQWIEGSVPADPAQAIRDAMLDPGSEDAVKSLLDRKFGDANGDGRLNPRCAEEREAALEKIRRLRENGRKGGRPKTLTTGETNSKTKRKTKRKPEGSIRASGSGYVSESPPEGGGDCEGEGTPLLREYERDGLRLGAALDRPEVRSLIEEWLEFRERDGGLTHGQLVQAVGRWQAMGPERLVKALRYSLGNGYKGVVEPGGDRDQPIRDEQALREV